MKLWAPDYFVKRLSVGEMSNARFTNFTTRLGALRPLLLKTMLLPPWSDFLNDGIEN